MIVLPTIVIVPFVAGLVCLLIPERWRGARKLAVFLVAAYCLLPSGREFLRVLADGSCPVLLRVQGFLVFAAAAFGFLIALYSERFTASGAEGRLYDASLLFSLGAAFGVLSAPDALVLLFFWGILGAATYLLIASGGPAAAPAAKKAFIVVGGSDAFLLLGVLLLSRAPSLPLALDGAGEWWRTVAFACFLIAALAKMGAVPLHSWLPDAAEKAPLPAAAFLPAALDKLAGVYLLYLVCCVYFIPSPACFVILPAVGAVTIVVAVLFALVQHDAKRLLGWHAVSQAGYMVLGIGTGTAAGVLGALAHMINNAVYKQALFLSVGAVEKKRGTTNLDSLGGLAAAMPATFLSFLVSALAISGVPPLNGFFSKWLIYQGVIEMRGGTGAASRLWPLWLIAAMFGSALTLASFMKLLHAIFLGVRPGGRTGRDEAPWPLWLPPALLAAASVALGVFAFGPVLLRVFGPAVGGFSSADLIGSWKPLAAALLAGVGLLVGGLILSPDRARRAREDAPFIGGEGSLPAAARVTGTGFYATLRELAPLRFLFGREAFCDLYAGAKGASLALSSLLSRLHNGVLPWYLSWALAALLLLLIILFRKS